MQMNEKKYTLEEIRILINDNKEELEKDYNAVKFFLFGSYARGEQTSESDIDILVELNAPLGLKFFKLEKFLENLFLKKVDLGTIDGLKPSVRDNILKEAVKI